MKSCLKFVITHHNFISFECKIYYAKRGLLTYLYVKRLYFYANNNYIYVTSLKDNFKNKKKLVRIRLSSKKRKEINEVFE